MPDFMRSLNQNTGENLMGFMRSIITLVAVCLCIGFAYAIGHGLSSHNNMAYVIGLAMLLAGAGIIAAMTRNRRTDW